jgi:hypothetical protein
MGYDIPLIEITMLRMKLVCLLLFLVCVEECLRYNWKALVDLEHYPMGLQN